MKLRRRIGVVTGAASGIGRGVALALAERGCTVALVDVNAAGLEESAKLVAGAGGTATTHLVDVANRAAMEALADEVIRRHGHVHVLVNNAGVAVSGDLDEQSYEDLEWIVGINFWGVVFGCKTFLPYLRLEEEGHIVNLSSLFGFLGVPGSSSYCATKAAVRSLSEALWAELSGTKIGVTSVHPGAIATNIIAAARNISDEDRQVAQEGFARSGMDPARAGQLIARAIERNQKRLLLRPEAYIGDWLKRLFPVAIHRALGWGYRRALNAR